MEQSFVRSHLIATKTFTVIAVDALRLSVLRYDTPVGEIKSPQTDYLEFLSQVWEMRNIPARVKSKTNSIKN